MAAALGSSVGRLVVPLILGMVFGPAGCGEPLVPETAVPVAATRSALTVPAVRLVYARWYNYGCSSCNTWGGVVEVENLAYDKQVTVAYQGLGGGAAGESAAAYLGTVASGRELWRFGNVGSNGTTQLRVRYRAAGHEFWDTNGGVDYWGRIDPLDGSGLMGRESPLGSGVDVVVTAASVSFPGRGRPNTELWTQLLVRNRTYDKQVRLVSSTDGWATVHTADGAYHYGDGPGGEVWTAHQIVDPGATQISFAVSARMDGSESWDNNFGANFTCRLDSGAGGWRCAGAALVTCNGPDGCRG